MRNNELNLFFKTVSFIQDKDGFFVGHGQNNMKGTDFKIAIFDQKIACFQNNEILFQIPLWFDLGTFLVLAQDVGIINEMFIYKSVEDIKDIYLESEEESFFDIDEILEERKKKKIK
jgi:hypothetical protein